MFPRHYRPRTAREDALHHQIQQAMNWKPEHYTQREDGRWFNAYGQEGFSMNLEEFMEYDEMTPEEQKEFRKTAQKASAARYAEEQRQHLIRLQATPVLTVAERVLAWGLLLTIVACVYGLWRMWG